MSNEVQAVQKRGKETLEKRVSQLVALGWSLCGYPFAIAKEPTQLMIKTGVVPAVVGEYRLVYKYGLTPWDKKITDLLAAGWKLYGSAFEAGLQGYQAMIKGDVPIGQAGNSEGPSFGAFGGRPTGVTTVFIGDSITGNGFLTDGAVQHDIQGPVYAGGTFARTDDYGFVPWADFLSDGGFGNIINAGIGGNTTQQILARVETDVLAHRPQRVVDECGTNNIMAGDSAATIIAQKQQLFDAYRKIGAQIIAFDIAPRGIFTTANRDTAVEVNRWLYEQASTQPDIAVFSMSAILADYASVTGGVSAARTFDDTHPNNLGAFLIAKALVEFAKPNLSLAIKSSLWPGDAYGSSAANAYIRNSNPGMAFTAGGVMNTGVTGQIADGFTCSRLSGAASVVGSIVERADGLGFSQRLVITFGAANESVEFGIPAGSLTPRYLAGKKMGVRAKLEFDASSANVVDRCILYTSCTVGGVTYQTTAFDKFWLTRRGNLPLSSGNVKGTARSPRYQMPAGASTTWSTQMRVYASGAGVVTLDISQYGVTLHP